MNQGNRCGDWLLLALIPDTAFNAPAFTFRDNIKLQEGPLVGLPLIWHRFDGFLILDQFNDPLRGHNTQPITGYAMQSNPKAGIAAALFITANFGI